MQAAVRQLYLEGNVSALPVIQKKTLTTLSRYCFVINDVPSLNLITVEILSYPYSNTAIDSRITGCGKTDVAYLCNGIPHVH